MNCIVCHGTASRRFGGNQYAEYYCNRHNPNDRRQKLKWEKRMYIEHLKLIEANKKEVEYIPPKIDQTPIKKEVKS